MILSLPLTNQPPTCEVSWSDGTFKRGWQIEPGLQGYHTKYWKQTVPKSHGSTPNRCHFLCKWQMVTLYNFMERSTVLVTLKTPFVLDKPMPADDLMFEKKHVSTEAVPHPKVAPWVPLKPRDAPHESLRINLKEGTCRDDDIGTNVGWNWVVGSDVCCENYF